MRGIAAVAVLCAVSFGAAAASARAASDGQVAVVSDERVLETFDVTPPSAATVRYTAPAGATIAAPAWSPDGNAIAFVQTDAAGTSRIAVFDLASGATRLVSASAPATPTDDLDPAWTTFGRILLRRASAAPRRDQPQSLLSIAADGSDGVTLATSLPWNTAAAAIAPGAAVASVLAGDDALRLNAPGESRQSLLVASGVRGTPAWSPDGGALAYATADGGLGMVAVGDRSTRQLAAPVLGQRDVAPAWAPDAASVVFATAAGDLRAVDVPSGAQRLLIAAGAAGGAAVPSQAGPYSDPAWQPCTTGTTISCVSNAPVLTLVEPRAKPCADREVDAVAGEPITISVSCPLSAAGYFVSVAAYGRASLATSARPTAAGTAAVTYTPQPSFAGVETIGYGATIGSGPAALRSAGTITIHVTRPVPRLIAVSLSRLDGKRRVRLRTACEHACTVSLRLRGRLASGRVVLGARVHVHAGAGRRIDRRLTLAGLRRTAKLVSVRLVGTLTGDDERTVSVSRRVRH